MKQILQLFLPYIYGEWDPKIWDKVVIFDEYRCGDGLDGGVGQYKGYD